MEDAKRTMSNQLERFQGLSETRWPLPSGVFCSSGEDRKALSRYINEYIAELEKSDGQIRMNRGMTTTEPPLDWDPRFVASDTPLSPAAEAMAAVHDRPPLGMSRFEYIKRQNQLFRELTGYRSWSELSARQAAEDNKDAPLVNSLELYMAALDEKIYMSADHLRAMIGIRDKEVRDRYDELKEYGATAFDLVEMRDMYQLLWFEHSDLAHQRDQLEVEMSQLRYDHALQQAKVVRLQYATHSLGRKLVDAQAWQRENTALKAELEALRRDNAALRARNDAHQSTIASQHEIISSDWAAVHSSDHKGREVEAKIAKLFELAVQLRVGNNYFAGARAPAEPGVDGKRDDRRVDAKGVDGRSDDDRSGEEATANARNTGEKNGDKLAEKPGDGSSGERNSENSGGIKGDAEAASIDRSLDRIERDVASLDLAGRRQYLQQMPPLELLELAEALIEMGRLDADKRLSSIIEAFGQQYRAREHELLVQIATLERERQILLARCEKLESENTAISSDLAYLEQRTLSLVLMLKSVRATLDQQGGTEPSDDADKPGEDGPPSLARSPASGNGPSPPASGQPNIGGESGSAAARDATLAGIAPETVPTTARESSAGDAVPGVTGETGEVTSSGDSSVTVDLSASPSGAQQADAIASLNGLNRAQLEELTAVMLMQSGQSNGQSPKPKKTKSGKKI